MADPKKSTRPKMVSMLIETFGFSPKVAAVVVLLFSLVGILAVVWIIRSAPPRTLVITSGPPGSTFERFANSYARILADNGVTLQVLPSQGSFENLRRLESTQPDADIGFVQGGLPEGIDRSGMVSLGSIAHQPLWIFYRGSSHVSRLSELSGKRIAIGALGSGTHSLALTLLKANGVTSAQTSLVDLDAEAASTELQAGRLDALFLMGDSASMQTLRMLIRAPDVHLFDFMQADAYVRKFAYLSKMELPQGSIDLGKNLPAYDLTLVGPTVELIARKGLNPALSDLLLEVAQEVHGKAGLLQKRGEFPAPLEHEFTLSEDALRYYKSGKGLLYRSVGNFWLASLLNRALVVFIPTLLILIPTLRFLPTAYKWRIQLRHYKYYRALLRLEHDVAKSHSPKQQQEFLQRLDEIEAAVNQLKVPASFGDQFYGLRGHISFVRDRLKRSIPD